MKTALRSLLRLFFGFRTYHEEVLRRPGPVLLIPNHVSLLDWLILGVCLEPDWKFVVSSVVAETNWFFRLIMKNRRTFPIDALSPYAARHMADFLRQGGRLVLFAEGRITRSGSLMKIFEGTGFLLHKVEAKVITAYVRGAVRLPALSRNHNLKQWFPRISVHFGPVLTPPPAGSMPSSQARQFLTDWLRDAMVRQQFQVEMELGPETLLDAIRATAGARRGRPACEDARRTPISYRRILIGAEALASQWRLRLQEVPEDRIGILLPNVAVTPVVLISLWATGYVPALLNYSTGSALMLNCAQLAGLRQIITSRTFIERARIDVAPFLKAGLELIYLEEVQSAIGFRQKLTAWAVTALGAGLLNPQLRGDDPATVLFTSGSEGTPKGVELTHTNLLANIRQVMAITDFEDDERLFNALPMFHSFGLAIGTLLPLVRGIFVFFYPSPLHFRVIPTVVYDRDCTILIGTNTFLNGYARRAHAYDFRQLRYLFAGAEKLQETTSLTWARRFGVRILEGYGVTETSPVLSVNTPMHARHGTAGRFVPGVEWRIEPVPGIETGGRLQVRGPNIMRGYLNPEANRKFQSLGGWYDTGDLASVDNDGYVTILGRLKRFAKISGEMVSLTAVEDALAGAFPRFGHHCEVAVVSRPDPDKGEQLVLATNEQRLRITHVREAIRAAGLSNLCAPKKIVFLHEIPKLGTGKLDHLELSKQVQSKLTADQ